MIMGVRKVAFGLLVVLMSLACTLTASPEENDPIPTAIPTIPTRVVTPTLTPTTPVLPLPTVPARPTSTTASTSCTNRASYIADITIPDGTPIQHGTAFTKTWRIQNSG